MMSGAKVTCQRSVMPERILRGGKVLPHASQSSSAGFITSLVGFWQVCSTPEVRDEPFRSGQRALFLAGSGPHSHPAALRGHGVL